MKLFNFPLLPFALLLVLFISLQSCGKKEPGYWKNDQIEAGLRDEFHDRNKKALACMKLNDLKSLEKFLSKDMMEDKGINRQVELIGNHLKEGDYELLDEYYAINKYRDRDTIKTDGKGINNYTLTYEGYAKEMYIAFFIPKKGEDKWIITAIYAKLDYGWKLCSISTGQYTFGNKTAPELFTDAKKKLIKGQTVDALLTMDMVINCIRPSDIWQYAFEEDMQLFRNNVFTIAAKKHTFPVLIPGVSTNPRIFRVFIKSIPEGTYPAVYYLTRIPLNNKAAVKEENDRIKKAIGNLMPGIDKDKKYILYAAFNELPKSTVSVDRYEVKDKLQ